MPVLRDFFSPIPRTLVGDSFDCACVYTRIFGIYATTLFIRNNSSRVLRTARTHGMAPMSLI